MVRDLSMTVSCTRPKIAVFKLPCFSSRSLTPPRRRYYQLHRITALLLIVDYLHPPLLAESSLPHPLLISESHSRIATFCSALTLPLIIPSHIIYSSRTVLALSSVVARIHRAAAVHSSATLRSRQRMSHSHHEANHSTAAPIIVTALLGADDAAWLSALRRAHFPPDRNHLQAHLTMFHHIPADSLDQLRQSLTAVTKAQPPPATITAPMPLGHGVALRVSCDPLISIRRHLAHQFDGRLTPQDKAGWRPHITVQNKVDTAAAQKLLEELQKEQWPRPLVVAGLAAWWYRGGPWELIEEFKFLPSAAAPPS